MVNFNSFSSHSIDSCWSLPFPTELGPYFIISIWWMFLWMILLSNTMVSLNRRFGREHRRPHKSKEHLIRIFFNISQIGRNTYTCRSCTLPLAKRLSCDSYQCFLGKPSWQVTDGPLSNFCGSPEGAEAVHDLGSQICWVFVEGFPWIRVGNIPTNSCWERWLDFLWLASSFSHQFHQKADAQNKQINDVYIYM